MSSAEPARPAPRRGWDLSYRARLMVGVCGLVLATGAAVTWLAFRGAQDTTRVLVDALFREVSAHAATHTRGFVLRAGPLVESLQRLGDTGLALDDSDRLARQLLAFLEGHPGLSWVDYGDEDGTFTGVYRTAEGGVRVNQSRVVNGHTHLVEHDVQRDGSWRPGRRDDDSGYDPRERPWYRKARQEDRLVWLRPYIFYNEGVPGVSCAAPVHDGAGRLRGVFSVDFDLNDLSQFVSGLAVSEHSKVFLFTADGTLLAYPGEHVRTVDGRGGDGKLLTLADTGDALVDAYRKNLRPEHLEPGAKDAFHFFDFRHGGTDYLASATTFRLGDDLDWVVGVVAPKDDFLSGVWRGQALALAVAAAALLVAVLLAGALARRVSGPVQALIAFMGRVGEGDLDARADLGGSREFRRLSDALNRMIADLRDRLRLRHSLDIAMDVQQRLLPGKPPRVRGLDVAGHSTYCDETGGDYYDFLALEEAAPDRLVVAVGDVMGHGVAAALVMAGARAVLRDRAAAGGCLADLMTRLNRLLSHDLEGTRFMTMHLSVVDARAGTFRFVSAGHDPALIYDPAADRFEEVDEAGLPLGIMEEAEYRERSHGPLRSGQVITVGTDGVWESPNPAGEQFGKGRLREVIRRSAGGSADEISQAIRDSLAAFRGEARQLDDITFVVVKAVPVAAPQAGDAPPAAAAAAAAVPGQR
jgi:sigma-B regulation protein RsbU (phosphoserine phosphatase)